MRVETEPYRHRTETVLQVMVSLIGLSMIFDGGCNASERRESRQWREERACLRMPCPLQIEGFVLTPLTPSDRAAVIADLDSGGRWDASAVQPGEYSLSARVRDRSGVEHHAEELVITVSADEVSRRLSLLVPDSGAGSGAIRVESCVIKSGLRVTAKSPTIIEFVNDEVSSVVPCLGMEAEAIEVRHRSADTHAQPVILAWPSDPAPVAPGAMREIGVDRDLCEILCVSGKCQGEVTIYYDSVPVAPRQTANDGPELLNATEDTCCDARRGLVTVDASMCAGRGRAGCDKWSDSAVESSYAAIRALMRDVMAKADDVTLPEASGRQVKTGARSPDVLAVATVVDGWNRELRFYFNGQQLVIISAGCDGRLDRDYTELIKRAGDSEARLRLELCLGEGDPAADIVLVGNSVCSWPGAPRVAGN